MYIYSFIAYKYTVDSKASTPKYEQRQGCSNKLTHTVKYIHTTITPFTSLNAAHFHGECMCPYPDEISQDKA